MTAEEQIIRQANEIARLRKGIQDYLNGDYENPRKHRKDGPQETCHHGQFYWQPCESCVDAYFSRLLEEGYVLTNGDRG